MRGRFTGIGCITLVIILIGLSLSANDSCGFWCWNIWLDFDLSWFEWGE